MFPEKNSGISVFFRGRLAKSLYNLWWNADERGLRRKTSRQDMGDHGLKYWFLNDTVSKKQIDTHAHSHTHRHTQTDIDKSRTQVEILNIR